MGNTSNSCIRYAELHCHSNFSFLDGVSNPEELVTAAAELGYEALALTDHNGLYGAVRFGLAAREAGLSAVFGAELLIGGPEVVPSRRLGCDPGRHVVLLADGPSGYPALARLISKGQLRGSKGAPVFTYDDLGDVARACIALTGCRRGVDPAVLVEIFGQDRTYIEVFDHAMPEDRGRNETARRLAVSLGVEVVATNNVHYAYAHQGDVATVAAAIAARSTLDEIDGYLPPSSERYLKSCEEMARRLGTKAVLLAAELGGQLAFDLSLVAPSLPRYPTPDGLSEMAFLRRITSEGAARRYPGANPRATDQLEHELAVIEQLGYEGYFLIVWDIVEFCRRSNIYCQGRGSAANSAVCYAIGITNADAVSLGLLFERFLSPEREGPPDIDLDIENGRREEVIQYVYERYGRESAAQVANVITYRARSLLRDVGKAFGLGSGQVDGFASRIDGFSYPHRASLPDLKGLDSHREAEISRICSELDGAPRHLGIHSGGMVIADRPLVEVCPVEWARMEGRSVLQWDKDDCAMAGLVKIDLLGLGMLSVLHRCVDLIHAHRGVAIDLATIPQEEAVYDSICEADTVGVFQIESRAQMATLPRLKPRCFYDLVVEVALIRPGPIQGNSVHPYLRRRNGKEAVTYLHPLLEPALKRTLGVPLFQEQLMRMAMDAAGFTPAQADRLRMAMSSKRSRERMEGLRTELFEGMAANGIEGAVAEEIYEKLLAFSDFGFPESHSVSFAYLVYASAWLRYHYPAEYLAACLNSQPMGFYSPNTLIADAKRHGVEVRGPDLNASEIDCTLEDARSTASSRGASEQLAVRIGLRYVHGLGSEALGRIAAARSEAAFVGPGDAIRRIGVDAEGLKGLAMAGAFGCFGLSRREALWMLEPEADSREPGKIAGLSLGATPPDELPSMGDPDSLYADLWSTGISPFAHPVEFMREKLRDERVVPAAELKALRSGSLVRVAGIITHRQRPSTANGTLFVSLEDETGMVNVIVARKTYEAQREAIRGSRGLLVTGLLERADGALNVLAGRVRGIEIPGAPPSRDFR